MKDIFDKEALQNLLRRNWSTFIHKNRLVAFVLQQVRDADLPESLGDTAMKVTPGLKLTISRVELRRDGVLLWIDFSVPTVIEENKPSHGRGQAHVGTCEAILSYDGAIRPLNLVGQTFRVN
jgi:hypothetical protein